MMMDDEKETHNMELEEVQHSQTPDKNDVLDEEHRGPVIQPKEGLILLKTLIFGCKAIIACAKQLNIMGEERGDRNYGIALARSATAIILAIEENRILATTPSIVFAQISKIIDEEAGDSVEGRIYSLFFDSVAKAFCRFRKDEQMTTDMWLTVLSCVNETLSKSSEIPLGTMLDALVHAYDRSQYATVTDLNSVAAFEAAIEGAENFAWQTVHMPEPCLASSINHKVYKYPDPEAYAVCVWMRAAYQAFKLFFEYK